MAPAELPGFSPKISNLSDQNCSSETFDDQLGPFERYDDLDEPIERFGD